MEALPRTAADRHRRKSSLQGVENSNGHQLSKWSGGHRCIEKQGIELRRIEDCREWLPNRQTTEHRYGPPS